MAPDTGWSLLQNRDNLQPAILHTCAMKNKLILTVSALLTASVLAADPTNDAATLLQRGLFEEEANHQLDAAIGNYKQAIEQFDHQRQLAATAVFRLGECYRKLGRTNEANAQFERIVREFPDQSQLAQLSRTYLPAGISTAPVSAPDASALPSDEEKFLQEVKESVQNSPDLVNQQLITAAQKGYVSAAEFLLSHGADVNLQAPIVEAASQGNEAMVQLLLSHGAAVNMKDEHGRTALLFAVDKGFISVCRTLLDHGADANLQEPILNAVGQGNEAIVQLLLSHGASMKSTDQSGRTPLYLAAAKGFTGLCRALAAQGADINAKDNRGRTPLHIAATLGNLPTVEFLVSNKAQIEAKDDAGLTPLDVAVDHGNLSVTEYLIANKAQIDAKSLQGRTPLLIAISRDDTNMVKLLLDNHADPDLETSLGMSWQLSPLAWAIYANRPEVVKLLLEGHADANGLITSHSPSRVAPPQANQTGLQVNRKERQANFLAKMQANQALVQDTALNENERWFLHNELHPPAHGMEDWEHRWPQLVPGQTPILWATMGNPPKVAEIVGLLLDHGGNANAVDADGRTALMCAIGQRHGNAEVVQALIAHGADVNALDKEGRPPLAQLELPLTETGHQIEALLVKAGADQNYNRRRGIWLCDAGETPKDELFQCPTNSINHYTLLEFLAKLYELDKLTPPFRMVLDNYRSGSYAHDAELLPFPDFTRVTIHRLDGKRAEALRVNVGEIFQSGDCSKDVALQAGDMVEIQKEEHKVADKWWGLSGYDVSAFNKCLGRTVRLVWQGHTNELALVPPLADAVTTQRLNFQPPNAALDENTNWLAEALKGGRADTIVRSFVLNDVVRDDNVLRNTWDLSRVRLTRGGANMTFDLTANPPPDVWLEDGDVLEIPEFGESAPVTGAK
jgi:ankyrin repeat protein